MKLNQIADRVMELVGEAEEARGTGSLSSWNPDLNEFIDLRIRMSKLSKREMDCELVQDLNLRLGLLEDSYYTKRNLDEGDTWNT